MGFYKKPNPKERYLEYLEKEVYVSRVIDGDTIEIKFENGEIKKLRMI